MGGHGEREQGSLSFSTSASAKRGATKQRAAAICRDRRSSSPALDSRSFTAWCTTRDFSSRYCSMRALAIAPEASKCTSIQRPKREELLLRTVLALPKASSSGVALSTCEQRRR